LALITISSSFGSGGEKVAGKVSEQLGAELFDDEKIQEKALSMGISNLKLKVDAAIIKNGLTSPFGFFYVDVTGKGKVHLWGSARNSEQHEKLLMVVKNIPEVTEVQSDIFVMPQGY